MLIVLQVDEGVASEAGLGLAMRLFNLDSFEILYEEKLQTKVCIAISLPALQNSSKPFINVHVMQA